MPGQEVECFSPALGIIPKVFLHVRDQLAVYLNPICRIRIQLSPFLHLLKYPWLYERPTSNHMRQAAAITQPLLCLQVLKIRLLPKDSNKVPDARCQYWCCTLV